MLPPLKGTRNRTIKKHIVIEEEDYWSFFPSIHLLSRGRCLTAIDQSLLTSVREGKKK